MLRELIKEGKLKSELVRVAGPGMDTHLTLMCPRCDTICSIVLSLKKRLWFKCGTLDCNFKKPIEEVL